MAALAKSAVTINDSHRQLDGGVVERDVTLVLTAQGTASNSIDAATLGFAKFDGHATLTKSDNTAVVLGVPSYDKSKLLLKAAATNAPADYTGTFRGYVRGQRL